MGRMVVLVVVLVLMVVSGEEADEAMNLKMEVFVWGRSQ